MRAIHLLLTGGALFPLLFVFNCSSGSTPQATDDGGGGDDTGTTDGPKHKDTGGGDDGGEGGPAKCSMTGSLDLAVKVVTFTGGAFPGVWVRAEDAANDCAEAQTGADGVAHVMVDQSKAPFDVTIATEPVTGDGGTQTIYQVISILGVSAAVQSPVTLSPQSFSVANLGLAEAKVGGAITVPAAYADAGAGPDGGVTRIQLDAWNFITCDCPGSGQGWSCTGLSQYSTNYQYITSQLPGISIPIAGILVDNTGKAVKGVYTPMTKRTGSAMSIPVDFTNAGLDPITTTITIQFPTSGLLAGSKIKQYGVPAAGNAYIGNAIVVKTTTEDLTAEQFVGLGNVNLPDANGQSTFVVQTFPAPMDPSLAEASLGSSDYFANIQPALTGQNQTVNVGAVNALTVTAGANGNLSDVTFTSDADTSAFGWTLVNFFHATQSSSVSYWTVIQQGAKVASRGLPHLPNAVSSADLGFPGASMTATVTVQQLASSAPPPWAATGPDLRLEAGQWSNAKTVVSVQGDGR